MFCISDPCLVIIVFSVKCDICIIIKHTSITVIEVGPLKAGLFRIERLIVVGAVSAGHAGRIVQHPDGKLRFRSV